MIFTQIRNATLVIEYGGYRFLVDPWLADLHIQEIKPTGWHMKPMAPLPFPKEEIIRDIDAVLVSHTHKDHFDEEAAKILPKDIPILTGNAVEQDTLRDIWGFQKVCNLKKESPSFLGVTIKRTEGQHGPRPDKTAGTVCGFLLMSDSEKTVYIAGDTVYYQGVKDVLKKYHPDIIVLNACGAAFSTGECMIMNSRDVAEVCIAAPNATIIASHMETVYHATVTKKQLRDCLFKNRITHKGRHCFERRMYELLRRYCNENTDEKLQQKLWTICVRRNCSKDEQKKATAL